MTNKQFFLVISKAALLGLLVLSPHASAQQFWDGPHHDNTTIEGGTGTWSNTNPNWANAQGAGGNTYDPEANVIFSGAAGIVTLGSNIATNAELTFSSGGYLINPNGFAIDMIAGSDITVNKGLKATINAPITGGQSGNSRLTKSGEGILILSGRNTFSGITTIDGGVLSISQDANLGTPPVTPVADQLTFNGGTLQATSFALNANRGITLLAGGGTIDVTKFLSYGGVVTGAGSLTKLGAGTLILSGVNTYSGFTAINAGVLSISQDANLGTAPGTPVGNQLIFNGGTLQATASFILNANRGITLLAGSGTIGVTGANELTYGGVITGAGSLTKSDAGTLTLTGANTYSGGTNLNGGTLAVGSDVNLGTGPLSFNSGTLEALTGITSTKAITLDAGGGAFLADTGTVSTLGGGISGVGSLTKAGVGTLVLIGVNAYTGGTTISAGALQIGNDGTTGSIIGNITDNGTLAFDRSNVLTFGGVISGLGIVQQNGTGTTVLVGDNTYAGGTTINAGTLQLGNGGTTGSIIGDVLDNGILAFDRSNVLTFGGVISGLGIVQQNGTGTIVLVGDNTYTGGTTINAGALQLGNGGTTGSITGNVANNGTLTFDRSDTLTFAGDISGAGSVFQIGNGTTILTGNNTYTGGTNLNNGILAVGSDANLGTGPLSFNGGTLEALSAGGGIVSSKAITLNGAGGTFLADAGTVSTLTGAITGIGAWTKTGTGALTLSGANTYTGATTVSAGVLQAGSVSAFSARSAFTVDTGAVLDLDGFSNTVGSLSGSGLVTNTGGLGAPSNATLSVGADNTSTTFSGTLQDGKSILALTKVGAGTLIVTGNNTYTGGTNLNNGILAVGSDANLGTGPLSFNGGTLEALSAGGGIVSSKAITLNGAGGTFLADAGTVSTLTGAITGIGAWTKTGTGALTLSGANTYTGATTVSAGVLQAGSVSAFSARSAFTVDTGAVLDLDGFSNTVGSLSGSGLVTNTGGLGAPSNATLSVGADNTSTTFSGTLQDGKSILALTKVGAGTLIVTGINTYTGTTTVDAGSLIVDGTIASSQTLVNAGGFLGGRGSLSGALMNSGIVSPGDSPGTLTVSGNYTQSAAGTLRIEIAGIAPSQHDILAVNGHASLAGTLQLIGLGNFRLHVGDQVTFLTANGGVSGSFGTVQNELSTGTLVKAQVVNLPNAVLLEGTQGSFESAACTPNSAAVAKALDNSVGDPRASTLIAFLNDQLINKLCGDFTLIAPEELASIFDIGVSLANVQTANLKRRMEDIRAGSTGFSAAGFNLNGGALSFDSGFAGVTGPEGKGGPPVMAPTPENRWGVWVTGIGEFTNIDSTNAAAGYDLQTGGLTLGVDYRLSPNFAVGLTGGYAHTNANLVDGGNLDVNGGKLGLYATAFASGFYLDTAVTGGFSGYNSQRTALLGSASGNTNGGELNVLVAGGYDWVKGGLSIGPTANFQYTYIGVSGFTETGSIAPLNIAGQNAESERTAFGLKASYDWKVGHVVIRPEISVGWQHEYGDQSYAIVASFANGAGNSFTVNSPQIGRDSLLIDAGATVLLSERISIYAYYDGELGRTNYQSNNVSAGVQLTF